jgi:DNA-directed RNA polymerase subunit H (RpoH/RPB5)
VSFRGIVPVEILTSMLARGKVTDDLPWDDEFNKKLAGRVRMTLSKEDERKIVDCMYPKPKKRNKMEIHNRVTKRQLALKPGDMVEVLRDDGTTEVRAVHHVPTKMGGHTWVAWLEGLGSFALCRCKPIKFDRMHPKPKKNKVDIHNRVTKKQLSLRYGDMVEVLRDDGTKEMCGVRRGPEKTCGTWMVWLEGIGAFALCRCKPIKVKPAKA